MFLHNHNPDSDLASAVTADRVKSHCVPYVVQNIQFVSLALVAQRKFTPVELQVLVHSLIGVYVSY